MSCFGNYDCDDVLAYDTVKLVRILDRRLGIIFRVSQLVVVVYVVVYVFIMEQRYLDIDKSQGWITVKATKPQTVISSNQASMEGVDWDVYDRITNPGELGAVFIPTRMLIVRGQTQGEEYCESALHTCSVGDDCDIRNSDLQKKECVNGHCMRRMWCPDMLPDAPTTEEVLFEFDQVELWFQSYLHYHRFQLDVTTIDEQTPVLYPHAMANTYKLSDLVHWTGVQDEDIIQSGAIMMVNANFDCNLNIMHCKVLVDSSIVESKTGYNYVHNKYYFEGDVQKRNTYRMFGIRVMMFTTGFAKQTSFTMIVLQLSSALALLQCAEYVADFYLQYIVPEKNHYNAQKVVETEDFNPDD
jgi:hypothetical protein|mmetsp:Transcript_40487/g.120048  ORF Transcript_40487/g.120048 Transcript_40487/m.120048 type:complete len:356 (-) Transcript_40487:55-1122(-)